MAVASAGLVQVCTSLQTDNHASTSPLSFLRAGCPSCRPTNSVKALKALIIIIIINRFVWRSKVVTSEATISHALTCIRQCTTTTTSHTAPPLCAESDPATTFFFVSLCTLFNKLTSKLLQFTHLCHYHWQSMTQMVTPYDVKLVFVQKITFILRKTTKTAATRAALLDPNMHHIVCRLRLRPRDH